MAPSPVASLSILGLMLLVLLPPAQLQGFPGGVETVSTSDPGVQQASAFAVEAYNKASDSPFYYKALHIVDARKQVVAGILYYLTEELVKTQCKKTSGSDLSPEELQRCAAAPPGERQGKIQVSNATKMQFPDPFPTLDGNKNEADIQPLQHLNFTLRGS